MIQRFMLAAAFLLILGAFPAVAQGSCSRMEPFAFGNMPQNSASLSAAQREALQTIGRLGTESGCTINLECIARAGDGSTRESAQNQCSVVKSAIISFTTDAALVNKLNRFLKTMVITTRQTELPAGTVILRFLD